MGTSYYAVRKDGLKVQVAVFSSDTLSTMIGSERTTVDEWIKFLNSDTCVGLETESGSPVDIGDFVKRNLNKPSSPRQKKAVLATRHIFDSFEEGYAQKKGHPFYWTDKQILFYNGVVF